MSKESSLNSTKKEGRKRKRETITFHSGGTSCSRYDQKDSAEAGLNDNVTSLNPPSIEQGMCVTQEADRHLRTGKITFRILVAKVKNTRM